jgi:zinc ribbon protein
MPNCPVCGKEVQSTTAYCPACGTSLKQTSAVSTTPSGSYSQNQTNYSYPQQGYGMPSTPPSHGHRKYILAIIGALLVGLIVGGLIGFFLPVSPDYTTLTGTATLANPRLGTPNVILFGTPETGNLTSAVLPNHSYNVALPIVQDNYNVLIQWINMTSGIHYCTASPGTFSSTSANATQNFSC